MIVFLKKIIFIYILLSGTAYAYMDPGSLAFIYKGLIAIFAGATVFYKKVREKIKNFISSIFKKSK